MALMPGENEMVWYEMTVEEILAWARNGGDEMEHGQDEGVAPEPPTYSTKQKLESINVVLKVYSTLLSRPTL
jgi:hypothetical protein